MSSTEGPEVKEMQIFFTGGLNVSARKGGKLGASLSRELA